MEDDFLNTFKITEDQRNAIDKIQHTKEHRILVFSEICRVLSKSPKDTTEAAMLFSEAKSLMRLLKPIEIQKK